MKIAVAVEKNNVSGHFGFCEGFLVFDVEDNKIVNKNLLQNPGHKPGVLPKYLSENKINVIIAGGMGGSAQDLFKQNGIEVVVGVTGDVDAAVTNYISGSLKSTGSVCHEHVNEENC
ncbi:MAG: NifB/NifX family molybdenum-iron cluster-binding protein [Clostridiaceae bacterium]